MKKKLMRFNLAALALVMVTSVLISGTFAKYTTAVSAQDTALIARWDISSEGLGEVIVGEDDKEQIQEMDLFGHLYDTAILKQATDGTPILGPGVEDKFTVNLTGTADVDATIDLQITKLDGSVAVPIQYAITGKDEAVNWGAADTTIYYDCDLLAEAILSKMATQNEKIKATEGEKTIILENSETDIVANVDVHWRWPFNAGDHKQDALKAAGFTGTGENDDWTDADDTALGLASAAALKDESIQKRTSYGLKLTLTAEQITPEATPAP